MTDSCVLDGLPVNEIRKEHCRVLCCNNLAFYSSDKVGHISSTFPVLKNVEIDWDSTRRSVNVMVVGIRYLLFTIETDGNSPLKFELSQVCDVNNLS